MLIIRKLTAAFGRLDGRTLELHRGLNVISGANESGKSTWTEFILAMLYGVDTRARARGTALPVKTRYLPWSGKPMAGRMELEKDGKALILERSSGSAPMSELSVRNAAGASVPELETPRCGERLIGAEAEVYRRSGCLRQQRAAVSADPLLERHLSSLVTTGSEDYAFAELDAKLKKLQNAVQYNQNGELPRIRSEKEEAESALRKTAELREQQNRIREKSSALQTEESRLAEISDGLDRLERQSRQEAVAESRKALEQAEEDMQGWEEVCAQLPAREVLQELRTALKAFAGSAQTAAMEDGLNQPVLPKAPSDPAFFQFNAQQALEKGETDAKFVEENLNPKRDRFLWPLLALLAGLAVLCAGIILILANLSRDIPRVSYWLIGCGVLSAVLSCVRLSGNRAAARMARQESRKLLVWYDARTAEEIREKASDYANAWELYTEQEIQVERLIEERRAHAEAMNEEKEALLERFRVWLPGCDSIQAAEMWLEEAAFATASLDQARRSSITRRAALERLEKQAAYSADETGDLSRFASFDKAEIRSELGRVRETLAALRSDADRTRGALEQMGDPFLMSARIEALQAREVSLQRRYNALSLARKALSDADGSLRARFSPLLCRRTGEIFSMLTEGKYDRVTLDREFNVQIHAAGDTLDRPLSYFSGGTVDQLYLALRLAICDLLLPGVPIILDDALVYFDDHRAGIALKVLKELGKSRQILLFTCQGREKRILDSMEN